MKKINKIFYFLVLSLLLLFINKCIHVPICPPGCENCYSNYELNPNYSYYLNFDFKDPAIIKVDEYVNTYFDPNAQNNTSLTSNTVSSLSNLTVSSVSSLANLTISSIASLANINVNTLSKISNSKTMMWQFREKLYEIKNGYPSDLISLEVTTLSNFYYKIYDSKKSKLYYDGLVGLIGSTSNVASVTSNNLVYSENLYTDNILQNSIKISFSNNINVLASATSPNQPKVIPPSFNFNFQSEVYFENSIFFDLNTNPYSGILSANAIFYELPFLDLYGLVPASTKRNYRLYNNTNKNLIVKVYKADLSKNYTMILDNNVLWLSITGEKSTILYSSSISNNSTITTTTISSLEASLVDGYLWNTASAWDINLSSKSVDTIFYTDINYTGPFLIKIFDTNNNLIFTDRVKYSFPYNTINKNNFASQIKWYKKSDTSIYNWLNLTITSPYKYEYYGVFEK